MLKDIQSSKREEVTKALKAQAPKVRTPDPKKRARLGRTPSSEEAKKTERRRIAQAVAAREVHCSSSSLFSSQLFGSRSLLCARAGQERRIGRYNMKSAYVQKVHQPNERSKKGKTRSFRPKPKG
jgi:hypothetical protein